MSDDLGLVRYRIAPTSIDGPEFANGAEVEVTLTCTVEIERLVDGMGGSADIRTLRITDWAGPWPMARSTCEHAWADARNSSIGSGEVCTRCGAVRAGNESS